ncbi:MAG: phosphate-starvation-inducible PsiE family protein [Hydrogenothermaceae bacterium]|nr:phosphate-starvation-inducible PsiE family protein [Hydrogenothermaceae bacterium]
MRRKIRFLLSKLGEKISNLDNSLINFLENFDRIIHLFLAILIVFVAISLFAWFIHDVVNLIKNIVEFKKNISSSALRLFGTAILLWPLSSLLKAEIELIKGGKISVNLFVDTAIASSIRSVLISSAEGENIDTYKFVIAIVALALVRLIVVFTENLERKGSKNGNL